jgi:DNA phosphorothioation-dependent restriction protein DptH
VTREANGFFKTRETFFAAVRDLADGRGVVEIADLHALRQETLAYIEGYLDLLRRVKDRIAHAGTPSAVNTTLSDFADVLRIDTLHLTLGPKDHTMEVVLLAPTHPLRVLWLFQYQTLLADWMYRMDGMDPTDIRAAIDDDVLEKLTSLNVPNTLAWRKDRAFVNTDNLGLFWASIRTASYRTCVPPSTPPLQGIGAQSAAGEVSTVTPRQIADKMLRYLAHHPYVQTLKVNVINPGDGRLLLEAIKQLLSRDLYADFNFDLKFFAPEGTPHQLVGSAFDELMTQKTRDDWTSGQTLSEVEERLLSPNENPLFPKLIYGKYRTADLRDGDGQRFQAHLTFVIDFFSTTLATRPYSGKGGSSSLYNLLAEYVTDYEAGKTTAAWSRMIVPSRCPDLTSDGNTARLHETHKLLAQTASSLFDWGNALDDYLTVQLELTEDHGKHHLSMLDRVHEMSDWVFTIDRNFGIEYFDDPIKGPGSASGGYLIDYTPEFLDGVAHRLIISTYHQQEVENILRNGFFELLGIDVDTQGETIDTAKVAYVLALLKSVSGRLALKLINNPAQAQEVIGLALTRLALEQQGRLKGRVLVPVDSHIGLFYLSRAELENADLTLKRTDLLLVELKERSLHIDLIEVKNRKASSPAALVELHTQIRDKNANTEKHFRRNFLGGENERLDSAIKHKELANILRFYFDRAKRYRLFDDAASGDAPTTQFQLGLEAVEAGVCQVSFGHEGFIFNGSAFHGVDVKMIHENRIRTYGRAGIAELLGINDDEEPSSEDVDGQTSDASQDVAKPLEDLDVSGSAKTEQDSPAAETQEELSREKPTQSIEGSAKAAEEKQREPSRKSESETSDGQVHVLLGRDLVTGVDVRWDPTATTPSRLLNQHLLIVGKSGSGKSETTKSLLYELDRQGVPSIIFDFQGEYATGEFFDVVRPQVFDVMEDCLSIPSRSRSTPEPVRNGDLSKWSFAWPTH